MPPSDGPFNSPEKAAEDALLRQWVEAWSRAGAELERLDRIEIKSLDTREAIRQIFGSSNFPVLPPAPATSGLIEQQAWFNRLRQMHREP